MVGERCQPTVDLQCTIFFQQHLLHFDVHASWRHVHGQAGDVLLVRRSSLLKRLDRPHLCRLYDCDVTLIVTSALLLRF